jgi:F-type H+-transporting ATPase subunit c
MTTNRQQKEVKMKTYNKALLALATVFAAAPAMAQEGGALATSVGAGVGLVALAVGIMMGLAVLGGTLGQSRAAAAALEGIARNPAASDKFTVPLILSLALMESLVLFAFLIGLFLQGSISAALNVIR